MKFAKIKTNAIGCEIVDLNYVGQSPLNELKDDRKLILYIFFSIVLNLMLTSD